jgi:16S rRNA G966 N2-methylase RsmD
LNRGRNVLDLFAGSGQLALEALSRGAASVDMVDKSKDAVKILAQNAKKTKLEGLCTVWCMDYAEYIRKNAGKSLTLFLSIHPMRRNNRRGIK